MDPSWFPEKIIRTGFPLAVSSSYESKKTECLIVELFSSFGVRMEIEYVYYQIFKPSFVVSLRFAKKKVQLNYRYNSTTFRRPYASQAKWTGHY